MTELVLDNCRVFSGSGWTDPVWYDTLSIKGKQIAGFKPDFEAGEQITTQRYDLQGATVLPGLCDAHMHLAYGGHSLTIPDLLGLSEEILIETLEEKAAEISDLTSWFEAFNWEPWRLELNRRFLDEIFSDRPAVIYAQDLHSCCCNSAVLKAAGILDGSIGLKNGEILYDSNNEPTGIIREEGVGQINRTKPPVTEDDWYRSILAAQDYLIPLGITAVSEVIDGEFLSVYERAAKAEDLIIDIDGWLRIESWDGETAPREYSSRLRIDTLKLFLDGSLGSRTAAMSIPYQDSPDETGILHFSDEQLRDSLRNAFDKGWRVALHVIGDRAVRQAVEVLTSLSPIIPSPNRLEHVQVLHSDNGGKIETTLEAIKSSGAVASMQPIHFLDDRHWLEERIGRTLSNQSFLWKKLVSAGIPVAFGSDWPVASPDPLIGIHTAINRCGFGRHASSDLNPNECLTPAQAIRAYSYGFAYAAGMDQVRGGISPSLQADVTVVSGLNEDMSDWSNARVDMTIIAGEIVYNRLS